MAAYVVIPVILLTIIAIWLAVWLYDRRFKNRFSSIQANRAAANTTCPNNQQPGIVYTIPNSGNNTSDGRSPHTGTDERVRSPNNGYTNQTLIVISAAPRAGGVVRHDLPPSYDQVINTRAVENSAAPS
ncbi:uncharacterized protein LOC126578888 [Anopheles aquasalis]|uniref:uncharacterized protein LOC126578888 n=1 Tax=Anopheles aquasalis TaxID=42839 RepID=UPI00215AD911|nr:uncharacterized protein LOC126578888 [Anopheles aquasalis]